MSPHGPQDFLGSAATQFPEIITIVNVSISVLCNTLFLIAIVYAFAAIALVIWPQSLVKVLTTHHTRTAFEVPSFRNLRNLAVSTAP